MASGSWQGWGGDTPAHMSSWCKSEMGWLDPVVLSNDEISYANCTIQIPANPEFKSLNLSHSLIIVAQVVASLFKLKKSNYSKSQKIKLASKKNIQLLASFCIKNLEDRNFFKPAEKKPIMLENLRSIFYKMELSEKETRILSSVFASLAKKLD